MKNENIPYVNLSKQWEKERKNLLKIIDKVISNQDWVGGEEVEKFEQNILKFTNTKYAVALNSGTDALTIGLALIGVRKNDEVITTPNSFIASTASIVHIGAKPIFVDVKSDQNIDTSLIESKITKKTKAIMPIHLTGRMSDMDQIIKLSKKYSIPIIEDAAQAIGSKYKNMPAGSFGKVGCFSAHPLKNLNAIGDSGYMVTNDKKIYEQAKELSNHGLKNRNKANRFGYVSRMDTIQAAILNYRLKKLNKTIKQRRQNYKIYSKYLNPNYVYFPQEEKYQFNTYHTFVIQTKNRNNLKKYLLKNGVSTAIHYPVPIHLQKSSKNLNYKKNDFVNAEKQANQILTLPINEHLNKNDIIKVSKLINNFFTTK
jgi:dTDP-4-amino-4,6-dideoxygalactose transaminase